MFYHGPKEVSALASELADPDVQVVGERLSGCSLELMYLIVT